MNIERIFHIDVNSAFRSWEAVYRLAYNGGRLDMREAASAVGGDRDDCFTILGFFGIRGFMDKIELPVCIYFKT